MTTDPLALDQPTSDELDELVLPSTVQAPDPLGPGAAVDPDGRLRIVELVEVRGRVNRYRATWHPPDGPALAVEVREGPGNHTGLQREAEVLASVQYAMLPRLVAALERDGLRYLVLEAMEGPTLDQELAQGLEIDAALAIVLQLTQALRRLQQSGWTLAGMSPAAVVLGDPVRITKLGTATRIGECATSGLLVPGYTAPEVAQSTVVTGKEDVYTLGAILYRAVSGRPIPEEGVQLSTLAEDVPVSGVLQLLGLSLSPPADRADLIQFYEQLRTLAQQRGSTPLVLDVGSSTTVGLNRLRTVNEDACGYLCRSEMHGSTSRSRAVLCVADGMGGLEASAVASRIAVETVLGSASGWLGGCEHRRHGRPLETEGAGLQSGPRGMNPAGLVEAAAQAVWTAAAGRSTGTTLTCLVVDGSSLRVAHVGDSRAYLVRGGTATRLTRDHSLTGLMEASGLLTPDEARDHPDSNKLLRSLGGSPVLPPAYVDTLAATCGQDSLALEVEDRIVLCTDGVWGVLDDGALLALASEAADAAEAARRVLAEVLRRGAPDNATTVVARCVRGS